MLRVTKDFFTGQWYFWDELPWGGGVPWDGLWRIVECRDRSWLACMALDPPDTGAGTDAERMRHAMRFHQALRNLGAGHTVWVDELHEPEKPYPLALPATPAARRYELERSRVYATQVQHYRSRHYLSVQWRRPPAWMDRVARWVLMPHPGERHVDQGPYLTAFMDRIGSLERALGFVGARIMDGDDLATYLHDTVSRHRHRVRLGDWSDWIAPQLVDMPIHGGRSLTIGAGDEMEHVVAVSIHSYPKGVDAGMLDGTDVHAAVAALPITYRRVTRIAIQGRQETIKDMERLRLKTTVTREGMLRQVMREVYKDLPVRPNRDTELIEEEVEAWLTDLAREGTLRCQSTTTFLVFHKDAVTALEQGKQIASVLRENFGLTAEIQGLNALEAFLGTLPGVADRDFVRPYVNTLAAGALAPLAAAWGGVRHDDVLKGPPLMVGTTQGTARLHVTLSSHTEGMASHALITGPSGSGKSALINAMCFGMMKYEGARVFRIDKGRSSYVATLCAGGVIIDPVATGQGFQPLRHIGASDQERRWAKKWLLGLVRMRRPSLADDPAVDDAINGTVDFLAAQLDPGDLTMSAFVSALGHPELQAVLKVYTRDGTLGYLFDCVDSRSYDADWITVELDELTDDADVAGPLMAVLWRMIRRLCSPERPMLIPIDEAWMAMEGPFGDMLEIGMRTFRRDNARVLFATQSAVDLAQSGLSKIMLNACSVRIFFPDKLMGTDDAIAAAYVKCGLPAEWVERMAYEFKRDEPRWCLLTQSGGERVLELDMGADIAPETFWMCCHTSGKAVEEARRVMGMPGSFLDNYLGDKLGTGHAPRRFPVVPDMMEAAE